MSERRYTGDFFDDDCAILFFILVFCFCCRSAQMWLHTQMLEKYIQLLPEYKKVHAIYP